MEKQIIATDKAPGAIGPYSQAIRFGSMIYTSGMIPVNPANGQIPDGIRAQVVQAITNLKAVLEAGGSSIENVMKTTLFIKNMDDFGQINEVYADFFASNPPSRSCVEAARLPKDVLIEIEASAYIE